MLQATVKQTFLYFSPYQNYIHVCHLNNNVLNVLQRFKRKTLTERTLKKRRND